jgi:putative nucleotidyltransferase with HDIG domain
MRLSELLAKKSGSSPDKVQPELSTKVSQEIVNIKKPEEQKPPVVEPAIQKPPERIKPPQDVSLNYSLPTSIYSLILQNARTSLLSVFQSAIEPSAPKDKLWETTRKIISDLSMLLTLDPALTKLLERDNTSHEKLSSHCINTALISLDLANKVKKLEFLTYEIGAAAILHDIGIAVLNLDFENEEDKSAFRKHVMQGLEILKEMNVPESIMTIVSQHHERLDGKGYPNGISGKDFLISSQVLALAETFERLMFDSFNNDCASGTARNNYVQETLDHFHNALDPEILKTFISIRGFYPNGTMIELTNRSICMVTRQNEGLPLRPVVQVVVDSAGNHPNITRVIDLSNNDTLSIIKAISYNGNK